MMFPGLPDRVEAVRERIAAAAARSGRDPAGIQLLAVTKVFPADAILEAHAAGLRHFGENYVQEFEDKAPAVSGLPGAQFHLIGHLQSNKAKRAAELFQAIHTVDSVKLTDRLNRSGPRLKIFVEVKVSEEDAKSGAAPADLAAIIETARAAANLELLGLMTVPPWSEDAELSRPYFAKLRALGEPFGVKEYSMGMSHDLEVAVEEGATWVRVGTALFGRRQKP